MTAAPNVTEQLTASGRAIEHGSFAIIDAEVGPHEYTAEQWPLVSPPCSRAAPRSSPTSR